MYQKDIFAVTEAAEIDAILGAARLGCLITHGPKGLFATHMPFVYDVERRSLAGHIARENPHPELAGDEEALIIFQGLDAYVSPSWYPSKVKHGRVVPTWNYEVAHVYGRLTWRREASWLRPHLAQLTDRFEAPRAQPWAVDDAPGDYLERMMAGVVGVELAITRVEAKRKLSQNRPDVDRLGVIAGLSDSDHPTERAMAELMTKAGTT